MKGFQTVLGYDDEYNLKNITTPSGKTFEIEQDKQGYITAITFPDGKQVEY